MSAVHAPRVVTFGELLLRLSPPGDERFFASDQMRAGFGGAEANVAVALAHLGLRADYVTRLPDNLIGDEALRVLGAEGVGTERIVRGPERMGIYFVEPGADLGEVRLVYDRAGSALAGVGAETFDWSAALSGAAWFHATGITPALGPGPAAALAAAVAAARSAGVPMSLDLNFRPLLWRGTDPRPLIEPLAMQAALLIANAPALKAMLGVEADQRSPETPENARELAAHVASRLGCPRVAITRREVLPRGEHGWSAALYHAGSGTLSRSRHHRVRVVDRLGGGDSFAAALIASLLGGRSNADALEFAAAASALKLAIPGDFNRATTEEIEKLIAPCT